MHGISMDAPSESPPACMAAPGNGLFRSDWHQAIATTGDG
jgi:hypothetical protein